jgi:hypothetical protein
VGTPNLRRACILAVAVLTSASAMVAMGAAPASASTASAGTDAAFRTAFADVKTPVTHIDLTADIHMNCGTGVFYRNGSAPADNLVVDGHGHTITGAGCHAQVLLNVGNSQLTLQDVTITGGDLTDTCSIGGAGVQTNGNLDLIDAQVSGNTTTTTATDSACAAEGGGITVNADHTVSLVRSTVSDNHAVCTSTCGLAIGGGIYLHNGTVDLQNSTVSDNTTSGPTTVAGGIEAENLTTVYSTIARNSAARGANLELENSEVEGSPVSLTSFASVIALPAGGGDNCLTIDTPTYTSHGYNYDDDGTCGFGSGPGDHSDAADPQLGTLAANGGPTETLLPQGTSPLVDAVPTAACSDDGASVIDPLTDQRSLPRPGGSGCDIGAVELQPASTTTTAGSGTTTTTNGAASPVEVAPQFTG